MGRDRRSRDRSGLVAALDIGSGKVACLIAEHDAPGHPTRSTGSHAPGFRVRGFAHQRSQGIRSGGVVDLAAAQRVVRAVVAEAEQQACSRVTAVHVSVNCGRPRSLTFSGHVQVADGIVRERDVRALASGAEEYARRDGHALLALDRAAYRLDGLPVSGAPVGLAGLRLAADHHAVLADAGPLHSLSLLVEGCHLAIAGLVPAGYAAALAATTADERRLGVLAIDIGADVTSMTGFVDGHLVFTDLLAFGGQHLTLDLAGGLGISLAEAERIKALYGTLVAAASDEHDLVPYQGTGEDEGVWSKTTRAVVGRIVRHRMQSLLQAIGACLSAAAIGAMMPPRIVLSGGTSSLLGLPDFVGRELGGRLRRGFGPGYGPGYGPGSSNGPSVRVASPGGLAGLVDAQSSPSFACVAGLQLAAVDAPGFRPRSEATGASRQGYIGRMERWLQDSF